MSVQDLKQRITENIKAELDRGPSPRGWHMIKTLLECEQKFVFEKNGVTPVGEDKDALIFGTIVHEARRVLLEELKYAQLMSKDGVEMVVDSKKIVRDYGEALRAVSGDARLLAKQKTILEAMMAGMAYIHHWYTRQKMQVVEVEYLIEHKATERTGKLDGLFLDKNGKYWLSDLKTSSLTASYTADAYEIDGQFIHYLWIITHEPAYKKIADNLGGFHLEMFLKKQKAAERFDEVFFDIHHFKQLIEAHGRTLTRALDREKELLDGDLPSRNWMACNGRYRRCAFAHACKHNAENAYLYKVDGSRVTAVPTVYLPKGNTE